MKYFLIILSVLLIASSAFGADLLFKTGFESGVSLSGWEAVGSYWVNSLEGGDEGFGFQGEGAGLPSGSTSSLNTKIHTDDTGVGEAGITDLTTNHAQFELSSAQANTGTYSLYTNNITHITSPGAQRLQYGLNEPVNGWADQTLYIKFSFRLDGSSALAVGKWAYLGFEIWERDDRRVYPWLSNVGGDIKLGLGAWKADGSADSRAGMSALGAGTLANNQWYDFEFYMDHDNSGSWYIKIDGAEWVSGSGDTYDTKVWRLFNMFKNYTDDTTFGLWIDDYEIWDDEPSGDESDPVVTINSPTVSPTYQTSSATITLSGTASDNDLSSVGWANAATSGSGDCGGPASWTCSSIALNTGSNAITVTGTDGSANTGTDVITVTRDEGTGSESTLTFYWRGEAFDFSGTNGTTDYSAGDDTGVDDNGAVINSDAARYTTNGMDCPGANDDVDYGTNINNIVDGDSANGLSFSTWIRIVDWIDNTNFMVADKTNLQKYFIMRMGGGSNSDIEFVLIWHDGTNTRTIESTDVNGALNTWYFVQGRVDPTLNTYSIYVNGAATDASGSSEILDITDFDRLRIGEVSGNATDFHLDTPMFTNDDTTDTFALAATTEYPRAGIVDIACDNCDGSYKEGDSIGPFTITFSEAATVTDGGGDAPELELVSTGANSEVAYSSGTGTTEIVFAALTVPAGFTSSDLDTVQINVNDGDIAPASGSFDLTLPTGATAGALAANQAIIVDTTAPTVIKVKGYDAAACSDCTADGTTTAVGTEICVYMTYTENLLDTGDYPNVLLALETGATDDTAEISNHIGTNISKYCFSTLAGQRTTDLDYVANNSLTDSLGLMSDYAGNQLTKTLAEPGAANSLGDNSAIVLAVPDSWNIPNGVADYATIGYLVSGDNLEVFDDANITLVTEDGWTVYLRGGYTGTFDANNNTGTLFYHPNSTISNVGSVTATPHNGAAGL